MGKLSVERVLDCFHLHSGSASCFCSNSMAKREEEEEEEEAEKQPLVSSRKRQLPRLKDVISGSETLAFQLKPKIVRLKVSMHCNGCAREVEKHISKMEGVSSYKVDLESKMVMVVGDVLPFEVLHSVAKVKNAELWDSSPC